MLVGNCIVKKYPDGTRQYLIRNSGLFSSDFSRSPALPPPPGDAPSERSATVSGKRTLNMVYDLARCNIWDYFITLTISADTCDRYDFDAVSVELRRFTRALKYRGCTWLIVPEQHDGSTYLKKGLPLPEGYVPGAWHFHGLVHGNLTLIPTNHFDHAGRRIYHFPSYKAGYCSCTFIESQARCAGYVAKYISKSIGAVPKNKRRYWASTGLSIPKKSLENLSLADRSFLAAYSHFYKQINSPYGHFDFYEYTP